MAEALDENYAKAGYHARQKWGSRPALLLIDFANAILFEEFRRSLVARVAHPRLPMRENSRQWARAAGIRPS